MNIKLKLRKQDQKLNFALMPILIMLLSVTIIDYTGLFDFEIAYSFGPANPEPYELGQLDNFFADPFNEIIAPYQATLGDFTLVIVWMIIIGVLWLRVANTMMVGVIGVALAALFTQGFSEDAQQIGYALLGAAIAVAIYQIITVRVNFPTN